MGRIAAGMLAVVVVASVVAPAAFESGAKAALAFTLARFGWFYLLAVAAVLLFMIYLAFGKHGSLRLGGPDAEPDFATPTWFAMLFSAGMGIGLVFFGASEPLSHLLIPPEGLTPETAEAARAAMRYSFFHWGLHPWAVYGLVALAIAYARFNKGKKGQISELLEPLFGRRWSQGAGGKMVDLLAVVATVGGVATTLGYGAVQITSGLSRLTGLPAGETTQLVVIAVATGLFLLSASTGLERGVKWLSNLNLVLAAVLLLGVLLLGPTGFIFDTLTTSLGAYLNLLPSMSLRLTPFTQTTWVADWTIFYWAWWISWAPFVGSFIARISRGRTVREFVVGVLMVPCIFGFIWFATFGGTALHQQLFEGGQLAAAAAEGAEGVLFAMFDHLPFATLLAGVAVTLLITFFVTSADSATLVIASMANEGEEPDLRSKILWGLLVSGIAVALLLSGGLAGLQTGAVISALPFALILCAVAASLLKVLNADHHVEREREVARRRKVDQLLASANEDVEEQAA